jgi:PIN domain nuclease of toxin-antitoxin system
MNVLLDTHALLWWWGKDKALSKAALEAIASEQNTVFVSAASMWEMATKLRIGKLPEAQLAVSQFEFKCAEDRFLHLPITWQHSRLSASFASAHADPFDRMLAAQSQLENAVLVTRDPAFAAFNIKTLW